MKKDSILTRIARGLKGERVPFDAEETTSHSKDIQNEENLRSREIIRSSNGPFDDGMSVLREIEDLYIADRETEALELIDRVLKLPADYNGQLMRLRDVNQDTEGVHTDAVKENLTVGIGINVHLKMGGRFLDPLMSMRSKCFASGNIKLSGEMEHRAVNHIRLLDEFYPGDVTFAIYSAEITAILGNPEEAVEMLNSILQRDPANKLANAVKEQYEQALRRSNRGPSSLEAASRLMQLQESAKSSGQGGLGPREFTDWLRSCCEIAQHLEQDTFDVDNWVLLISVLMNTQRYEEASMALKAVQSFDPSSNVCDRILGEGATRKMMEDISTYSDNKPALNEQMTPEQSARMIGGSLRAWGAEISETIASWWLPLLASWVLENGAEPKGDDKVLMCFLLRIHLEQADKSPSVQLYLYTTLLAITVGENDQGCIAFMKSFEYMKSHGEQLTDANASLGSFAQELMKERNVDLEKVLSELSSE